MGRKKYVVIMAAGSGSRMGSELPKQFLEIGGKPILRQTIERFLEYDPSIGVVVVLPASGKEWWKTYCRESGFIERYTMATGGITRFHSVQNALKYVPDDALVAIHDGVRPFVTKEFIAEMFDAAEKCEAVIPVVPSVDSLREVGKSGTSCIVDRETIVCVQTPQIFRSEIVKKAYAQPFSTSFTDDASVVEAFGYRITLKEGLRRNFKITTPDDYLLAEAICQSGSLK